MYKFIKRIRTYLPREISKGKKVSKRKRKAKKTKQNKTQFEEKFLKSTVNDLDNSASQVYITGKQRKHCQYLKRLDLC